MTRKIETVNVSKYLSYYFKPSLLICLTKHRCEKKNKDFLSLISRKNYLINLCFRNLKKLTYFFLKYQFRSCTVITLFETRKLVYLKLIFNLSKPKHIEFKFAEYQDLLSCRNYFIFTISVSKH